MKVLIAEDDKTTRMMLEKSLQKWGYEVVTAADGEEAMSFFQEEEEEIPRLYLLDWVMPGPSGPELCEKLNSIRNRTPLYIILLTGRSESQDVVQGFEAGADDYVVKPYVNDELRARVNAGRRIVELEEALAHSATHDYLTGVCNRRQILHNISRELARAEREKSFLSVAMIDIDRFKKVNDTYGHLAGDDVLKGLVKLLGDAVREYDYLGRFGGEEFVMILPGFAVIDDSEACFERLRKTVRENPIKTRNGVVSITVSIGVAFTDGLYGVDDVIQCADEALYRAKEQGRDKVVCKTLLGRGRKSEK